MHTPVQRTDGRRSCGTFATLSRSISRILVRSEREMGAIEVAALAADLFEDIELLSIWPDWRDGRSRRADPCLVVRIDRRDRSHRPALERDAAPRAAPGVRADGSVRAGGDQSLRRCAARRGTGTTSTPVSTPAPTSTPRCTGSPEVTRRTWRRWRCRRSSPRRSSSMSSTASTADPNFLIEVEHLEALIAEYGPFPDRGWLLCRTGWSS